MRKQLLLATILLTAMPVVATPNISWPPRPLDLTDGISETTVEKVRRKIGCVLSLFLSHEDIPEVLLRDDRNVYLSVWDDVDSRNIAALDEVVKLSGEQKEKLKALQAVRRKAVLKYMRQNGLKLEKAAEAHHEALESGDQARIDQAQKVRDDLEAPPLNIWAQSQRDILNVLTDKQRLAWRTSRMMAVAKSSLYLFTLRNLYRDEPITLSDEQVRTLLETFADLLKDETFGHLDPQYDDGEYEKWNRIRVGVYKLLTDEQKALLGKERTLSAVRDRFWGLHVDNATLRTLADAYDEVVQEVGVVPVYDPTLDEPWRSLSTKVINRLAEQVIDMMEDSEKDRQIGHMLTSISAGIHADENYYLVRLSDEQRKLLTVEDGLYKLARPLTSDEKNAMLRAATLRREE